MTSAHVQEPDLQEVLQADAKGVKVREMLALVDKSSKLVSARLRGQLATAEFKAAEQMTQALDATDRVLRKVWESLHGKRLD
jgi:hypothetical protein